MVELHIIEQPKFQETLHHIVQVPDSDEKIKLTVDVNPLDTEPLLSSVPEEKEPIPT